MAPHSHSLFWRGYMQFRLANRVSATGGISIRDIPSERCEDFERVDSTKYADRARSNQLPAGSHVIHRRTPPGLRLFLIAVRGWFTPHRHPNPPACQHQPPTYWVILSLSRNRLRGVRAVATNCGNRSIRRPTNEIDPIIQTHMSNGVVKMLRNVSPS